MPSPSPAVESAVRAWLVEKQAARPDGILRVLSDYDGVLAIGTGAAEWLPGPEQFRSGHVAGGPFTATIEQLEAHEHGDVAWAAVVARADFGAGEPALIRLSLVLVRTGDTWQIVHSHASLPAGG